MNDTIAPGNATAPEPAPIPTPPPAHGPAGKFTEGSTLRHVAVMTATGSIGLVAIFVVDFLNLFYISLLGEQELAAAIGYSGTLIFIITSVGIGLTIGVSALVSRALGARDRAHARTLAASGLAFMMVAMGLLSIAAMIGAGHLVALLGATGRTYELAVRFLLLTLPSSLLLGAGMAFGGILRSVGDAKRAMWVTLAGGIAAAIADPILIFGLGLGFDGAAIATNISRLVLALVGIHGAVRVHDLVARPDPRAMLADLRAIGAIAGPAVLTNIATPVANGYVTAELARHGDGAVAAWAIIGRLVPVAFGAIFALSGSVGPIIGQNQGARRFDRVRRTLTDSLALMAGYTLAIWIVLLLAQNAVIAMFSAKGEAAELLVFFLWISVTWLFMGALFVANAAFNTLGTPFHATIFNWGRATLGTIPLVYLGGRWWGAEGVLLGQAVGGIAFGIAAVVFAYRVVAKLEQRT